MKKCFLLFRPRSIPSIRAQVFRCGAPAMKMRELRNQFVSDLALCSLSFARVGHQRESGNLSKGRIGVGTLFGCAVQRRRSGEGPCGHTRRSSWDSGPSRGCKGQLVQQWHNGHSSGIVGTVLCAGVATSGTMVDITVGGHAQRAFPRAQRAQQLCVWWCDVVFF